MSALRFAVIDLDSNEPMVAFDAYDEAEECRVELTQQDIRCMIDTVEENTLAAYRL